MKFEGLKYRPGTSVPEFFERFLVHYDFVIKFLTAFNENRFNFREDIKVYTIEVGLNHGVDNTLPHRLGYQPAFVQANGRVEMLNVTSRTPTNIIIRPKLLTTMIIEPPLNKVAQRFAVADATLFKIGDSVLVGDQTRRIRTIQGNVITLDESVLCGMVYVISLATETVQLLVY